MSEFPAPEWGAAVQTVTMEVAQRSNDLAVHVTDGAFLRNHFGLDWLAALLA